MKSLQADESLSHCTMERWVGRVALVTGTSAGIGAAIAYQLQDHGINVVAVARRVEKIEEAVAKAREGAKTRGRYHETKVTPGKLYAKKCDIAKEEDILGLFKWIKETLGGVDILVNNAGLAKMTNPSEAPTEEWKLQLDVNVLGLSICTREAVQSMRTRGVDDGHIIHISSVVGHFVFMAQLAMYCATKHAVMALTEGLRKDFVEHKSNMKITCVSPGAVATEIGDDNPEMQTEQFLTMPRLQPEDCADAVLYAISTPPHVQIHEIIIKPVGEQF
ncbi:farnesol dehydrogenase [Anabrus simplex]|uniref:farnesol dehydrogenase n=1 Tax=Anabrus simplex TaxID=316456 RepID=UPI0035A3422C